MKFKRFSAYMIDILLVVIILLILKNIVPIKQNKEFNQNMMKMTEQFLNKEISIGEYYNEFSVINYNQDKNSVILLGFNTLIVIFYFIIIPIITKGYTLGMYITGIKYEGKINVKNLFLRNIITTGILQMIVSLILVYLVNNKIYLTISLFLGIIQLLLVIISAFMISYRKDLKGIQDIISNINIIEVKE